MIAEWPIVSFIAAFLASQWFLTFGIVCILSVLGDVIWDIRLFSLWRFWNYFSHPDNIDKPILRTLSKKTFFIWIVTKIQKISNKNSYQIFYNKMDKRFFWMLFIVKITPIIWAAGHMFFWFTKKISLKKYISRSVILCVIYESVFLWLWYFSGMSIKSFQDKFDIVSLIILVIVVATALSYFGYKASNRFKNFVRK